MHPKTKQILDDLRARGIDVSGMETQLNAKPDADKFFADGFTRTQEFTKLLTDKRGVDKQLELARTELAAAQSQISNPNNGLTAAQMQVLQTRINGLEEFLKSEDYPEEQVNNIFKDIKPLFAAPQNTAPNSATNSPTATQSQQGKAMTEEQMQQFLRTASVSGATLGLGFQMQVQKAYAEFANLYGRFPNSTEISQLETAIAERTVSNGEGIDVVAADVFNFAGKRKEIADADLRTQLAAAKEAGRAEALQAHPELALQTPRARSVAPVARHFQQNGVSGARVTSTNSQTPVANPQVPVTPPNPQTPQVPNPADPNAALRDANGLLPFQQRGNQVSRLQHLNAVAASKPEIFEDTGYSPLYGSQNPQ